MQSRCLLDPTKPRHGCHPPPEEWMIDSMDGARVQAYGQRQNMRDLRGDMRFLKTPVRHACSFANVNAAIIGAAGIQDELLVAPCTACGSCWYMRMPVTPDQSQKLPSPPTCSRLAIVIMFACWSGPHSFPLRTGIDQLSRNRLPGKQRNCNSAEWSGTAPSRFKNGSGQLERALPDPVLLNKRRVVVHKL